jgi:hypothetical protein
MAYEDHWLPGFNFNVEDWFEGDPFDAAIAEKPAARFMIRQKIRVVKRHPEDDW